MPCPAYLCYLNKQDPKSPRSGRKTGAGNEARTRDLNLGKVALYQLSYSRMKLRILRSCHTESSPDGIPGMNTHVIALYCQPFEEPGPSL